MLKHLPTSPRERTLIAPASLFLPHLSSITSYSETQLLWPQINSENLLNQLCLKPAMCPSLYLRIFVFLSLSTYINMCFTSEPEFLVYCHIRRAQETRHHKSHIIYMLYIPTDEFATHNKSMNKQSLGMRICHFTSRNPKKELLLSSHSFETYLFSTIYS